MCAVAFKIGRISADELKTLHKVCFGKPGAKTVVKKNLREFSGFTLTSAEIDHKKVRGPAAD